MSTHDGSRAIRHPGDPVAAHIRVPGGADSGEYRAGDATGPRQAAPREVTLRDQVKTRFQTKAETTM